MKKENKKINLILLLLAFLFVTLISKNSFLYRFNDWWDANAFMTVGKSMVRGTIPYIDLFEQKGPLLYLLYGLASLISDTSFIGIYLFEIISFFIVLVFAKKIIKICFDKDTYIIPGLTLFTCSVFILKPFTHGGSAEEFILPLFMISFYYLFQFMESKNENLNWSIILLNGIIAGCVLWTKYTLLGFWFIWEATLVLTPLLKKEIKTAFLNVFYFLGGMLLSSLPWIIYFGIHNALPKLFEVYFLTNMTSYAGNANFLIKIIKMIGLTLLHLFYQSSYLILITIPIIYTIKKKMIWKKKRNNIIIYSALLFTAIFAFIGGKTYAYYALILAPFMIIGILYFIAYLTRHKIMWNTKRNILFITCTLLLSGLISNNTSYILKKRSDYAQFKFADIIKKSDEQTLLNFYFLDGGFYTAADNYPKYYYFMKNNIYYDNYKIMFEEQKRYIKEKQPKYVVTKRKSRHLKKNYKIIAQHHQIYESKEYIYYLYERKVD